MQQLKSEYIKKGYLYTLIVRTEDKALYSQKDIANDVIVGHEIFLVKIIPEYEMAGNVISTHEKFPSDLDFGKIAWSVGRDLDRAMNKFVNLQIPTPILETLI